MSTATETNKQSELDIYAKDYQWNRIPKEITRRQRDLSNHELRVGLYIAERMLCFGKIQQMLTLEEIKEGYYTDNKIIVQGTGIHINSIKKAIAGLIDKGIFLLYKRTKRFGEHDDYFFFVPCEASEKIIESMKQEQINFYEFRRKCFTNKLPDLIQKFFPTLQKNLSFGSNSKKNKSKIKKQKSQNMILKENNLTNKSDNVIYEQAQTIDTANIDTGGNKEDYTKKNLQRTTTKNSLEITVDDFKKLSNEEQEIFDRLLKYEITENVAKDLIKNYSLENIENQLNYMPYQNYKNAPGFLIGAIKKKYPAPTGYQEKLKVIQKTEDTEKYLPAVKIWDPWDNSKSMTQDNAVFIITQKFVKLFRQAQEAFEQDDKFNFKVLQIDFKDKIAKTKELFPSLTEILDISVEKLNNMLGFSQLELVGV